MSDAAVPPLRRFYQGVSWAPEESGFAVLLDGRRLKTPAKRGFGVPTQALVAAIAAEWSAQGAHIRPEAMPLTRLANVAIDRAAESRAAMIDGVAAYLETDLLCHRAAEPERLAQRQAAAWDPPLAWVAGQGVALRATAGIIAIGQPAGAFAHLRAIAAGLDDFALTGLAHAAGLTGSAILALCLAHRAAPRGEALFQAAALDELWSLETWGGDTELEARVARLRADLAALEAWFAALAAP